ncbi:(2Fe-2S)-binding protein [Ancylobacter sp. Lp-2]|uniref:(2Fe-2S)-binding protein n=1 Tax=Ancylobacter sp. Lp-2 TaxID=2881339 RepID=UPI001E418972|nr:(2Fe-2S)-binding protein [Ancylobacter sp. Lp-2]MCB4771026.1 (2Fe-2S)-binding protein [Ancylobacter sp. Lp-2]
MFKRHNNIADAGRVEIMVDGRPVAARTGDTVAAALLLADVAPYRLTALDREPRAPFCLMGVCFDCLVTIDGLANRQACLIEVRNGMRVERQLGLRELTELTP